MQKPADFGYLCVFVVPALLPAAAWLAHVGVAPAWAAWFPMLFLFGAVPLLDWLLGPSRQNPAEAEVSTLEQSRFHRWLTWLVLPVWLGLLAWATHYWTGTPMPLAAQVGWLVSTGIIGGVLAINTAHELIHKDGRLEPALGGVLLASVCYAGFKVEHLRGHHVHVSTPQDTSSARYGEIVYGFVPRAMVRNFRHAWQLEARRLRQRGLPALHWRNELIGWYGLSALLALGAGAAWGWQAAAFFVLQGLIAGATLEIINYIEHYGLHRREIGEGRYERVDHRHSWNSNYRLTNWMLFQLQRHADHHANARRRYQVLRHFDDSPQLPAGYATMFLVALLPPLWKRVIDPRVQRHLAGLSTSEVP